MAINHEDPEVQAELKALLETQVNAAVAALKAKNSELLEEKKRLKDAAAEFADFDKDTLKNYIARLKNDEEARLIAEGKVGDVIDRRTERMRESYQSQIADTQKLAQEWQGKYSELEQKFNYTRIDSALRDAALAANVVPSAIDDIITRGRKSFEIDANGNIISKDQYTGDIKIGADGKNPYAASDFLSDLKKTAPHFWPQSQSGGFTGASAGDVATRMQGALNGPGGFEEYRKLRAKMRKDAQ